MKKNSKIYIAGHTGLVGGAILNKLKSEGYNNLLLRTRKELNLLNQNDVFNFLKKEKSEYVILSAAKVGGIKANMTYPADFLYDNLQIQNNIIWGSHLAGIKKLLFLGSSCIYPRGCKQPIKEEYLMDGKLEPTNEGYALAKISGMKLCEKINEQYGKNFISCMPTNIYGPGDNFDENSGHVIPALIKRMHEAKNNGIKEISIWGTGSNRREFLYVDDLADACVWLMNNYNEKEFINIGTGDDISIKELAYMIKKIIGYTGNLIFDTSKPDGMLLRKLDVSKINKEGWKYSINLSNGLEMTYKYFLKNELK
ncbi:GDP-fucose synthetase [Candidatus Gracilibacteria bacterium]|nr:MAG: GDP-fucose synthetase [Candidatus Gracilibacteria bacterium]PIE85607.1 MAG: GDP-fucose synthetase [Candidatus Gracilibacteria bacterium]